MSAPGPADWSDVQVFLALLDAGTFGEAGRVLGMNSSTVGRRLDRLEAAVGVQLFERSRAGIAPTLAAHQLTESARHFERAAAGFAHATGALETEPVGRVVVSAPSLIASQILGPALATLHARHPRLTVVVDTRNAFADLDRHEADLALRAAVRGTPLRGGQTLRARRLGRSVPSVVLGSPDYAASLGQLTDLGAARWVTFRQPDNPWARKVLHNVPEECVVMQSDDPNTLLSAVRCGVGLTIMTRIFAGASLVEVPLAPLLRHLAQDEDELWLVGHQALRDVPRVAAVWDHLSEALDPVLA